MTTVAEVLAQTLAEAGVEVVFGLPGGENTEILDAIRRNGLEFVLVKSERSAVFMADATARLTGKPGVCLTTLGPGATNAYSGVAHAFLDRAPVLIITAQSDGRLIGKHTHQVLDLQRIFQPVTKFTCALSPIDTQGTVLTALTTLKEGRPGPVHLGVSSEIAKSPVVSTGELPDHLPPGTTQGMEQIQQAQALLARSRRPVFVVGLGLEPEKPYAALRHLAEKAQTPVIVTPKAKGSLPADHPLAAGTIGLTHTDPVYKILDEADCIVALGFDVVELVKPWDQTQPTLWIAAWENNDPVIAAEYEFVGSMEAVLRKLSAVETSIDPDWGAKRVKNYRLVQSANLTPVPARGYMRPQEVLDAVRKYVPRDTLVTTDVGSHKILASLYWPAYPPNRFLVSNGLSSMGFGLPAAIAASKQLKEAVVCIIGDGGMAMVVGELGLLKQLSLPVIIVMMRDDALDLIRSAQMRTGKPVFGTEFNNPDYRLITQGYGIDFYQVSTAEECEHAIRAAIGNGCPAMIEALIDPASYPTTPNHV